MADLITAYLEEVSGVASAVNHAAFYDVAAELIQAAKRRRTIIIFGNGASSTTADHFANDLSKSGGGRLATALGFGLRVISLPGSMPFLTALANDISLEAMFREAIRTQASSGDLLVVFAASAPHESVVEAVRMGREKGLRVVAVTGADYGPLADLAHVVCPVPSTVADYVEDVHLFLCHCWTATLRQKLTQPVVLLDRDGVVNLNRPDHVKNWGEFVFVPDAAASIRRLNEAGYAVVVITNQSAVGRGLMSQAELEKIHRQMCQELADQGAWVSRVYYCPHRPDEGCPCRKPGTGLIERAFTELPLDLQDAFLVGDHVSDIIAGNTFGIRTILVTNGRGKAYECDSTQPSYVAADLMSAVEWILKGGEPRCEFWFCDPTME